MSDSLSRIADDIEQYHYLCQRYHERVECNDYGGSACYGPHADFLEKFHRGTYKGLSFEEAKKKFYDALRKAEMDKQIKIQQAKDKLTKEEQILLGIR